MLAEGVVRLLRKLGDRTGCLLMLEDLHWADEETLGVLEYLADNLATERTLCLATVRRGEHSPAERRAQHLAARRAATVLDLAPLTAGQVEQMGAACLRLPRLPSLRPIDRQPRGRRALPGRGVAGRSGGPRESFVGKSIIGTFRTSRPPR